MPNREEVAIVGYAARLPGARTAEAFWSLLRDGRAAIGTIGPERFPTSPWLHPSTDQHGRSYTFAAGLIDDPWGFDAQAFGMSPREAEQVDPQQRHLLEVTHDALAMAGVRPSSLVGSSTGVYVGASSVDYGARFFADPAAADVHMMTGNTLSIVSNRLSYALDLNGPSFTVDTACSSSLVALNLAADAIRNGTVETAIVGGVNLLLSPFSFVGFSRASMLSPTGLCRPFDAAADGYVRAEGVIVLILRAMSAARKAHNRVHAAIIGSGVGQDGRTTGLSLPSPAAQRRLLEQVYGEFTIDPGDLSFVEAHGTGTKVGDPIEADALGKGLAQKRSQPLSIGSVKSNIGHLEPASGLAGVLKSILALRHGVVPATLHQRQPNPDIPFEELNLRVIDRVHRLPERRGPHLCGVNSFGFGGTNAHIVLRDDDVSVSTVQVRHDHSAPPLLLSAHSAEALPELAAAHARHWPAERRACLDWIAAAAHLRDALLHRVLIHGDSPEQLKAHVQAYGQTNAMGQAAASAQNNGVLAGRALGSNLPVAFLFSGNGAQWAGMGQSAWQADERFREALRSLDERFQRRERWSLVETLFDEELAVKLRRATYAQPLIVALQMATVWVLEESGLSCSATLGHSVGEIAAAWAAGHLSVEQAFDVVIARSRHQEQVRGVGTMAALMLGEREARRLLESAGVPGTGIAAINSWRSVTVSGPAAEIERLLDVADEVKVSARRLDLDYPFHSALTDPVRGPLLRELAGLRPLGGHKRLVSTVTGQFADAAQLGPEHWWHNVREPVLFEAGLSRLIEEGYRIFVEVGAKPILSAYVRDALRRADERGAIVETLTDTPAHETSRPLDRTVSKVLLAGGQVDYTRFFGPPPVSVPELPLYPWRHTQYRVKPTPEAAPVFAEPANALLGSRLRADACEWYSTIDPVLFPWIADHKVGGVVLFPATAFVEVLLAAARQALGDGPLELRDLDILRPLAFEGQTSFETSARLAPETGLIEFRSRPRGSAGWTMHARGVVSRSPAAEKAPKPLVPPPGTVIVAKPKVYQASAELGFGYGPSFQRARHVAVFDAKCAVATLEPPLLARSLVDRMLDIAGFDAAFHSLFASEEAGVADRPMSRMVPVRFAQVRLFATGVAVAYAVARTVRRSPTSILADIDLLDSEGRIVLAAQGVRLIDVPTESALDVQMLSYRMTAWRLDRAGSPSSLALPPARPASPTEEGALTGEATAEALLLLEAGSLRAAWQALSEAAKQDAVDTEEFAGEHEAPAWPSFLKAALLWYLETKGLVEEQEGERRLAPSCDLPDVSLLVRSLLARHPTMGDEAAELARLQDVLPKLLSGLPDATMPESGYRRRLAASANQIVLLEHAVLGDVTACLEAAEPGRLLRLLLAGTDHLQLVKDLASRFANVEIVVTDLDGDRVESARAALGEEWPAVRCVGWHELETLEAASVDLACSIDGLCRIAAVRGGLVQLLRLLRPRAPLVAGELAPSVFWDIVRGTNSGWWARSANAEFPVGALLTGQEWADELQATGFADVGVEPLLGQEQVGVVIHALAGNRIETADGLPPLVWEGDRPQDAESVLGQLTQRLPAVAVETPDAIVWAIDARDAASVDLVGLTARLATRLSGLAGSKSKLWVLVEFAKVGDASGDGAPEGAALERPLWTALTAALRVAQNEHASLDIRCLGMSGSTPIEQVVEEFTRSGAESEVFFENGRRLVFRVDRGIAAASAVRPQQDKALQLSAPAGASRGALSWSAAPRAEPGPDEVEIEVAATGLNFRDVMWNLRMLPEEALEDGYAGPKLGMECAGTVVRVGAHVDSVAVGDPVVAFVPGAFASHVVAPAFAVCRLPGQLSFEAAATIPVAFLTAYYSLVHLARLQKDETVLVHGGAGAVGLAALQVAKHVGAKVIATAGTDEKRALLRHLGADAAFNSRTPAFADEVLAFGEGKGVDVVLNSLAGEVMIRSMDCLKPFGRFIELGKRDFYGNTHLGLRPFRRNLSYFGVDVDQLIGEHRALTQEMFGELLELFASGELSPLPHREFRGQHIEDAFRLMQRSGHIGKILVRPAERATVDTRRAGRFPVDAEGLHIVFGGTSGFGLATATWLVRRGARHVVLASRSGRVASGAEPDLEALRNLGADVQVKPIDIANETALSSFLNGVAAARPIKGIIHAAMVLDDRLIDSMDRQAIEAVLQPKVKGALNLDRLTRGYELDYFLLYSSATTLLGNPGQYNYVTANAFLEGLARRRAAEGLPALAVAWGAIEDTGYLARNIESNPSLKKRFSSSLLSASRALDGLDWAYDAEGRPRTAFCAIARIDWGMVKRELAVSRRALLASVLPAAGARQAIEATALLEKLRAMPLEQATAALLDIIVDEIARVLRLAPKEVDRHRPLGEIGMDSLMMLELRTTIEDALQVELPLMSVANGITPADVARRIAPLVLGDKPKEAIPGTLLALSTSHIADDVDSSDMTGRTEAARAVLERSRALEGPL